MDKITISTHLAIHHQKGDGTCGIYLRITINRLTNYISLRKFIKPEHFNTETKMVHVTKDEPNAAKLNRFIADEKKRAEDIIFDFQRMGVPISFELFKRKFEGEGSDGFIEFCREQMQRKNGRMKQRSLELEESKLRKLEEYQKHVRIYDINKNWLEKYRTYLANELHNKINTVHGDLRVIRKYIKMAFDEGIIPTYPFHHFKMSMEQVNKEYLTFEELEILQKKYESGDFLKMLSSDKRGKTYCVGKKYQDVLQHFLISCYTGLRHSDVSQLRFGHIRENKIVMKMEKGEIGKQKTVRIPLTKFSKSVLDLEGKTDPEQPLYSGMIRGRSNTNSWLKIIMKEAGINKYITFHCARHTFAINSIVLGIPIEVVSDLLGHSDLRTTQIYAKIVDRKREDEMMKWDNK